MPPSPEHWKLCANLCTQLGPAITVTIISYPLAPNSAAKDSLPALCALYPDLFSPYTNNTETEVSFAGDSAGGNVALALVLKMLREKPNAPAPVKVLLICPAVDLRPQPHSSSSSVSSALKTADAIDPLLGIAFTNSTAETWSLGSDAVDPDISPLLADPGILANRGTMVYGITAGADVLAPPAIAFAEACREKGVQGRWMHWEGLMHCFVLAGCYGIREGKEGVEWLIEALKE
jgi:acetyl esterase/lipase